MLCQTHFAMLKNLLLKLSNNLKYNQYNKKNTLHYGAYFFYYGRQLIVFCIFVVGLIN